MSGFLPFHWISSVYFPFHFTDYYYRYPEYQYTTPRNYYDYTGGLTEEEQLERAVLNSLNERGKASIVFHISNYDSYWGGRNTGKMYCSWFISSLFDIHSEMDERFLVEDVWGWSTILSVTAFISNCLLFDLPATSGVKELLL